MKYNDFVNKPRHTIRQQATQFVLQNDALDSKYKSEIDDLNAQLGHYRRIEAERDGAMSRLVVEQERLKDLQNFNDQISEELSVLKTQIAYQDDLLQKIPDLEESVRNAKGELSNSNNELQNITSKAYQQSQMISALGSQVDALLAENKQLTEQALQDRNNFISAEEERKQASEELPVLKLQIAHMEERLKKIPDSEEAFLIFEKNQELEIFSAEMSKINRGLKEERSKLVDKMNFWEKEAQEARLQLEQAVQIEGKLRKWITDLERDESVNKSIEGGLNNQVSKLETTLKDMGLMIEDLMKEISYLSSVNREYRKELMKPRFMSQGAIAKGEGFTIPIGKENIRTQNLGNSAPKLLKFKPKEA